MTKTIHQAQEAYLLRAAPSPIRNAPSISKEPCPPRSWQAPSSFLPLTRHHEALLWPHAQENHKNPGLCEKVFYTCTYSMLILGLHPCILSPQLPLSPIKSNFFPSQGDCSVENYLTQLTSSHCPPPQKKTGYPLETHNEPGLLLISPCLSERPLPNQPPSPKTWAKTFNFLLQKCSIPLATGFLTAFALLC